MVSLRFRRRLRRAFQRFCAVIGFRQDATL